MLETLTTGSIFKTPRFDLLPWQDVAARCVRIAMGEEMFGARGGPWGILCAPVPLLAFGACLFATFGPEAILGPWATTLLGEIAWLCWFPFLLAALMQTLAMVVSDVLWKAGQGRQHIDYSPRLWHYQAALALACLPLIALQFSDAFLDFYLRLNLAFNAAVGSRHAGYSPGFSHLLVVVAVPILQWQANRALVKIPCGRLWGLQRELAKLRGAVTWQPDAWAQMVGEAFDRWMQDLLPPDLDVAGEHARQHRLRWTALRKELVEAWRQTPPDLSRANQALSIYRKDW